MIFDLKPDAEVSLVSLALGKAGFQAGDGLTALVFGEADVLLETVLFFEGGGGLGGDAGAVEEFLIQVVRDEHDRDLAFFREGSLGFRPALADVPPGDRFYG